MAALQLGGEAARTCSVAGAGGADFQIWDDTTTASGDLASIYRRRGRHVTSAGRENGGFDDAVAALEARHPGLVRLGQVTDAVGERHYQLFLAPDADEVVGCLWVRHEWTQ